MRLWNKVLYISMGILITLNLCYIFSPNSLIVLNNINLSDSKISNTLMLLDILFSSIISIKSYVEQRKESHDFNFSFSINDDTFNLPDYILVTGKKNKNINSHKYIKKQNHSINSLYYGIDITLHNNWTTTTIYPITIKLFTNTTWNNITFSNLNLLIENNDRKHVTHTKHSFIKIDNTIDKEKTIIIRTKLLYNNTFNEMITNSSVYLCFCIKLKSSFRKSKKYVILYIQNIDGEGTLFDEKITRNIISYKMALLSLKHKN